jgi:hypothetical protein
MTDDLAQPDVPGDGQPIAGELVTLDAIQPSAEQLEQDRANRKSRTGQQAFAAGAVVTIVAWLLRLNGVDLNPLADSEEIPTEVTAAWTALMTYAAAVWMNRGS